MQLNFLEASVPLTKTFVKTKAGYDKTSYPNAFLFTSHFVEVGTPKDLYKAIKGHAAKGHCLLKGTLNRELNKEPRAGSTDATADTEFVVFDLDGLDSETIVSFDDFLASSDKFAAFRNVDYVLVESASAGITAKGLHKHAYFLLSESVPANRIKQWFLQVNLEVPVLASNLRLSRTGNALKFALDVTVNQNDKLLFDTPPVCKGFTDPLKGKRIQLVTRKQRRVSFDFEHHDRVIIEQAKKKALNELRKTQGLAPRRSIIERVIKGVTVENVATNSLPEITGIKEERGFVYLNLNGGDSWGYYHPATDPNFLYNFKGEPTYQIKDLLPSYYPEAVKRAKESKEEFAAERREELADTYGEEGAEYYAFMDRVRDTYMRVTHFPDTNELEVLPTNSLFAFRNFQRIHGHDLQAPLEEWDVIFDPSDTDSQIRPKQLYLNTFEMSPVMRHALRAQPRESIPKIIYDLILHAAGSDKESAEYFINWLAFVAQRRNKTGISVVFQGTFGTGKGTIFNRLIEPIIGAQYCPRTSFHALTDDQFNEYAKEAIVMLIDEADTEDITKKKRLDAILREYITEPTVMIRGMRLAARREPSFLNLLIFSNEIHTVNVRPGDRRFSIMTRQETPIKLTAKDIAEIDKHVPAFAEYLMHCEVDEARATRPLLNEAREYAMDLSMNSHEQAFNALLNGDFGFLLENAPHEERPLDFFNATRRKLPTYAEALIEAYENRDAGKLSRDAIETFAFYLTDVAKTTPHAFSAWIKHKGIHTKVIKINGVPTRGLHGIQWDIQPEHQMEVKRLIKQLKDNTRKTG